jgi:hypothetical protein
VKCGSIGHRTWAFKVLIDRPEVFNLYFIFNNETARESLFYSVESGDGCQLIFVVLGLLLPELRLIFICQNPESVGTTQLCLIGLLELFNRLDLQSTCFSSNLCCILILCKSFMSIDE